MSLRPWTLVGMALSLGILGITVWLGIFRPGGIPESPSESGDAGLPSAPAIQFQKKMGEDLHALGRQQTPAPTPTDHRLFVSRTLLFLPKEKEQVQPLDPEFVTSDGIKVGWKLDHGFSPADPDVAARDDDQDGFSNAEEYEKGTNPRDSKSTPSKWVKLRFLSAEPASLSLGFPGKWTRDDKGKADRYTLRARDARIKIGSREKSFDLDVSAGDRIWIAATGKKVKFFRSEQEARQDKEIPPSLHLIPIEIKGYQPNFGKRKDPLTQLEVDFDDSSLSGKRSDGLPQDFTLIIDGKNAKGQTVSRGVVWDVSDYRLTSMVPGEGEMGPYRPGQTFVYSGKEFLLAEGQKDRLTLKLLPEKEELKVFPRTP